MVNKKALSLTEMIVALVIVGIVTASTIVFVNQRAKVILQTAPHGQYTCYKDIDGNMHEHIAVEDEKGEVHTTDNTSNLTRCEFTLPEGVKNYTVTVVGGGGGGGGGMSPQTADDEEIDRGRVNLINNVSLNINVDFSTNWQTAYGNTRTNIGSNTNTSIDFNTLNWAQGFNGNNCDHTVCTTSGQNITIYNTSLNQVLGNNYEVTLKGAGGIGGPTETVPSGASHAGNTIYLAPGGYPVECTYKIDFTNVNKIEYGLNKSTNPSYRNDLFFRTLNGSSEKARIVAPQGDSKAFDNTENESVAGSSTGDNLWEKLMYKLNESIDKNQPNCAKILNDWFKNYVKSNGNTKLANHACDYSEDLTTGLWCSGAYDNDANRDRTTFIDTLKSLNIGFEEGRWGMFRCFHLGISSLVDARRNKCCEKNGSDYTGNKIKKCGTKLWPIACDSDCWTVNCSNTGRIFNGSSPCQSIAIHGSCIPATNRKCTMTGSGVTEEYNEELNSGLTSAQRNLTYTDWNNSLNPTIEGLNFDYSVEAKTYRFGAGGQGEIGKNTGQVSYKIAGNRKIEICADEDGNCANGYIGAGGTAGIGGVRGGNGNETCWGQGHNYFLCASGGIGGDAGSDNTQTIHLTPDIENAADTDDEDPNNNFIIDANGAKIKKQGNRLYLQNTANDNITIQGSDNYINSKITNSPFMNIGNSGSGGESSLTANGAYNYIIKHTNGELQTNSGFNPVSGSTNGTAGNGGGSISTW